MRYTAALPQKVEKFHFEVVLSTHKTSTFSIWMKKQKFKRGLLEDKTDFVGKWVNIGPKYGKWK